MRKIQNKELHNWFASFKRPKPHRSRNIFVSLTPSFSQFPSQQTESSPFSGMEETASI